MSKEHYGKLALKAHPREEAGRMLKVSSCLLSGNKTSLAWTCLL